MDEQFGTPESIPSTRRVETRSRPSHRMEWNSIGDGRVRVPERSRRAGLACSRSPRSLRAATAASQCQCHWLRIDTASTQRSGARNLDEKSYRPKAAPRHVWGCCWHGKTMAHATRVRPTAIAWSARPRAVAHALRGGAHLDRMGLRGCRCRAARRPQGPCFNSALCRAHFFGATTVSDNLTVVQCRLSACAKQPT